MSNKIKNSVKILPIYITLSSTLYFYHAISTIYMTAVKGLTPAEFISLGTIAAAVGIIIHLPLTTLIKKLGNLNSARLGCVLLLISSLILTFGNTYFGFVIAFVIHETVWILKGMESLVLKNNLNEVKKSSRFTSVLSRTNIAYSIITLIIAALIGTIFNINEYFPMYLCTGVCVVNIILSKFIIDPIKKEKDKVKEAKLEFDKTLLLILVGYLITIGLINIGYTNGLLFIQEILKKEFSIKELAQLIGIIIACARIFGLLGNLIFNKIYKKFKSFLILIIPYLLFVAFGLMICGFLLDINIFFKIIIMALGYVLILFVRDPLDVFITDLILKHTKQSNHVNVLSLKGFAKKLGYFIVGGIVSLTLINHTIAFSIMILFVIAYVAILINFKLLNRLINKNN